MSTHLNLSLKQLAAVLGGGVAGGQVLAPAPGHKPKDRGMSVRLDANAPDGFLINLFNDSGGDEIFAKDYVRAKLNLPPWKPNGHARPAATMSTAERTRVANARVAAALSKQDAPERRLIAAYDYKDTDGALLYQVERFEPKT